MKLLSAVFLGLSVAAFPAPAFAASGAGANSFQFLFLDAGARSVGLGGAYTALAADSNALLYNPAGLGRLTASELTVMHNEHFEGIRQEYAAVAFKSGWSVSVNRLDFGESQRTTVSNPAGTGLGKVGLTDLAVGVGYGAALSERLSVGFGAKYLKESIAGTSASGFAGDLGLMLELGAARGLTLGAAVQNLGPEVTFQGQKERLPLNIRAGAALKTGLGGFSQVWAVQAMQQRDGPAVFSAGVEAEPLPSLPIRAGFDTRNEAGTGLSLGMGLRLKSFFVDYAFSPYGDLGDSHRLSLSARWGRAP